MPSSRRIKTFAILVFILVITILFYTASLRQSRTPDHRAAGDFYTRTVNALEKGAGNAAAAGMVHQEAPARSSREKEEDAQVARDMSERLKQAAQVAKSNANAKAPKPDRPSSLVGVGSAADGAGERGIAGRRKYGGEAGKEQVPVHEETEEEHAVEMELNSILKRSPIIIFSKSYCPYSKKAKQILLKQYTIEPEPFVVELDQHKLGQQLQDKLQELTGRRTVPNILINAISIGGGDDVAELHANKKLMEMIKELGGKKIKNVVQRPAEVEEEHGLR